MGLPSQLSLLTSLTAYPLILHLFSGPAPTPQRLAKSIKGTSTLHSTLTTLLALHVLSQPRWYSSHPPTPLSGPSKANIAGRGIYPDDMHNPTISGRSEYANVITAIEAGYLVQDTFALIYLSRLQGGGKRSLDKTLVTHHITIGAALLILHYYISQGREAGIYIIVQFLLMNASTPILNLRWYLRNFAKHRRKSILAADAAFVVAFFLARVWLGRKILSDYGRWHGWSAWEAYWEGLRVPCKLGTGALMGANAAWWGMLVVNTIGRTREFTLGGQ
ncbi:hypothetical protein OEA41_009808 [Lepraria neglecta]|uniref:TLC domain-containing protein n=1 Tax=Lepraria neglecta TaxID=209136 RepID=A0AAD9YXT9_9LECA|nr:hypothetical protein OEA41_009808 [Lepraria neglecta]